MITPRTITAALVLFLALSTGATAAETTDLAALFAKNNGRLSLDKTTYHLTKPLEINLQKTGPISIIGDGTTRIIMDGPGPAIHLIGTHDGTAAPSTVDPSIWKNERGPVIAGIEIVGNHPKAEGIRAEGTMQLRIRGVTIRHTQCAIHLAQRNRNVIITACNLYENHGIGLFLDDVNLHQINVTACHISYNGGGGIVSRAGAVRNLHITGCDIEGNMSESGPPTANVLLDGTGSSYGTGEVAITGCTIQHTHNAPNSANIRILGAAQPIANLKHPQLGNITITGNILSNVHTNIHLDNCRAVTITGNTLWDAADYQILATHCTALVVGANALDRNPYYDRNERVRASHNAVKFVDCRDSTIQGLHLSTTRNTPAGMLLKNCHRMNINGCTILDCAGPELKLVDCENCRISGCLLQDAENPKEENLVLQNSSKIRTSRPQ